MELYLKVRSTHFQDGLSERQIARGFLPRSSNAQRQTENLDIFDFKLSDIEMQEMKTLDLGMRTGPGPTAFKMM